MKHYDEPRQPVDPPDPGVPDPPSGGGGGAGGGALLEPPEEAVARL